MSGRRILSCARPLAVAALLVTIAAPASAGLADLGGTGPGDLMFPSFAGADGCAGCHGAGSPSDTAYLPFDTWAGTMMANAARDPVFFAALAVANQDVPGVGTYCLRCHSPIGFVRGHADPPDGSAFDAVDRQGIGCETCHRALPSPPPDAPYLLGDAQLVYGEDPIYAGPFADSVSPAHATAQDEGLDDPRFCGQCHQVTNPEVKLRDAAGAPTPLDFPLDTTFTEWADSAYADASSAAYRSCTDCHMPKKSGAAPITSIPGAAARDDVRVHAVAGGNHWGIAAVKAKNPARAAAFPAAFDRAQQAALASLAGATSISLEGVPAKLDPGAPFTATIRVANLTGHKFPTGYAESRRAWIAVVITDEDKHEEALLGGYDPATGSIQASPPTHVYRAVHGRWDGQQGQPEEHLALHDMILADTRIPPLGFHAAATTTPSGEVDFSDGQGGYRSYDEATFTLTAPASIQGEATVEARLYYQSMTRDHIDFLRAENVTDSTGDELAAIYAETGEAPPLAIAVASAAVTFPGGSTGSSSSSSSASSSSSSSGASSSSSSGASSSTSSGAEPVGDGGCDCAVAAQPAGQAAPAVTALALLLSAIRRRRRRR